MNGKTAALVAVVVVSNVGGNFALKRGMDSAGVDAGLIGPLAHPLVVLGISILILWTISRIKLFEMADLSWVVPVTSIGYVLTAAVGAIFLSEHITAARWVGTVLIVAGASLTGLKSKAS
jgi:uncharacterized membrane protein